MCIALTPRPAALMQGYQGDDGQIVPVAGAFYRTGDVASRDTEGYLTYVGRDRRHLQSVGLPDQPVRAGERADRASGGGRGRGGAVAGSAASGGAEGVHRTGAGGGRRRGDGGIDLPPPARAAGAVQAGASDRVCRTAEDDLRQDTSGRAASRRGGPHRSAAGSEFRDEDFREQG